MESRVHFNEFGVSELQALAGFKTRVRSACRVGGRAGGRPARQAGRHAGSELSVLESGSVKTVAAFPRSTGNLDENPFLHQTHDNRGTARLSSSS